MYNPSKVSSKRIKNKNLKIFFKKPLIYWSIAAATESKLFKKIIVSTDNKKIARYARKFRRKFLFRSKKNSSDSATVHSVVIETIEKTFKIRNKFR